jgi:hypothetical protein
MIAVIAAQMMIAVAVRHGLQRHHCASLLGSAP